MGDLLQAALFPSGKWQCGPLPGCPSGGPCQPFRPPPGTDGQDPWTSPHPEPNPLSLPLAARGPFKAKSWVPALGKLFIRGPRGVGWGSPSSADGTFPSPKPNRGTKRTRDDDDEEPKTRHKPSGFRERGRYREEDPPAAEESEDDKKKPLHVFEKGEEEEEEVRISSCPCFAPGPPSPSVPCSLPSGAKQALPAQRHCL